MQNAPKDTESPSFHPHQPPPLPYPPPSPPLPTQTVAAGGVTAAEEGGSSVGGVTGSDYARTVQVADFTTPGGDGSVGEGGSSEAVSVEGGVVVAASMPQERQGKQKRKSSQLSDPPPWPPKCNECGKEFPSWKAAFGHMRAHPDRDYRGFFRPPTSSSSSPRQRLRLGENMNTGVEQGGGEKGASSVATGGVRFDLNQPTTEEVEPSDSEAAQRNQSALESSSSSAVRTSPDQEGKNKVGFDLNQLPSSEDDHDRQHKP